MLFRNTSSTKYRYIYFLLSFLIIFSSIIPIPLHTVFADDDPGFRITGAEFKFNGIEEPEGSLIGPFDEEDTVSFKYLWSIDEGAVITDLNKTLTVNLPEVFPSSAETLGDLLESETGIVYGTYRVQNRVLTFTFNETAGALSAVSGGAMFDMTFDFQNIRIDEPYTIIIPITGTVQKTYHLKIKAPVTAPAIGKKGSADANKVITWTIDVNQNLSENGEIVVTDNLDSRLVFDPDSVIIHRLAVDSEGDLTESGAALASTSYSAITTLSVDDSPHEITFTIPPEVGDVIPNAYRIEYESTIDPDKIDTTLTQFTYTNSAAMGVSTSSAAVGITGGNLISKSEILTQSAIFNTDRITWEIAVNEAEYPLQAVRVEDILPSGLAIDDPNTDVKVYDKDGLEIVMNPLDISYDSGTRKLVVTLGGINTQHDIRITTMIDPDYIKGLSVSGTNNYYTPNFSNTATLYQTQNGTEKSTSDSHNITNIKIGKLIYKTGTTSISYNEAKYTNWQIFANLAEMVTTATTITDELGPGQILPTNLDDIKVYRIDVNNAGTIINETEITAGFTKAFDLTEPTRKFSVTFDSPISSAYVIKYTATILPSAYIQDSFANTGKIDIGLGIQYVRSLSQGISNTFEKFNTDMDGDSKKFDYNAKTFDWRIRVNPIKEAIEEFVITDVFSNELIMSDAQFDNIIVKKGSDVLLKDTDYTITKTIVDSKMKGFVIKFADGAVPHIVNNAVYTVDYKTSIDPDVLSLNGNLNYQNHADFTWKDDPTPLRVTAIPSGLSYTMLHNGNKSGTIDPASKTLTWSINLNYLSRNINNLIVTDDITIDGNGSGMRLIPDSIKVYKDTVDANGNLKTSGITQLTEADLLVKNIVITPDVDHNSFQVSFHGTIEEPYRIVYSADMVGISSTSYGNTANTNSGENYSASVSYSPGLTFVDKTGARGEGLDSDYVYWELTINESKSTISNLKILDRLSEGLTIDISSIKLFKGATELDFDDYFYVEVKDRDLLSDPQEFDIIAKVDIDETYKIKYRTLITNDYIVDTEFSNKADIVGQYISSGTRSMTKTIVHNIMQSMGWAVGELGGFKLTKVDEDGAPLQGAKFEFFKGATKIGDLITDVLGEIVVEKLKYATYTLVEIQAPAGFQITNAITNIVIDGLAQKTVTVENDKLRTLDIYKVDKNNGAKFLQNAVFEIKNSSGTAISTVTTDSNGKATTDLPYGVYTVKETVAPSGYHLNTQEFTITIDSSAPSFEVIIGNDRKSSGPKVPPPPPPLPPVEPDPPPVIVTDEDTPVDGDVDVPEDGTPEIKEPPTNGEVEIDEDGKWKYTPDPGYVGKDKFVVSITKPDGSVEDIIIEIDVEKIPFGPGDIKVLPQTGDSIPWLNYFFGLLIIAIGCYLYFSKRMKIKVKK